MTLRLALLLRGFQPRDEQEDQMDRRQVQSWFRGVEREQRELGANVEKEDALEIAVLCLLLVVSVVGVGMLATLAA